MVWCSSEAVEVVKVRLQKEISLRSPSRGDRFGFPSTTLYLRRFLFFGLTYPKILSLCLLLSRLLWAFWNNLFFFPFSSQGRGVPSEHRTRCRLRRFFWMTVLVVKAGSHPWSTMRLNSSVPPRWVVLPIGNITRIGPTLPKRSKLGTSLNSSLKEYLGVASRRAVCDILS